MAMLALIVNSYGLDFFKDIEDDYRMPPAVDNSTYGNVDEIHTVHLDIDLTADFEESKLFG